MNGYKRSKTWHKRWVRLYATVSHSHFGEYVSRRIRRERVAQKEHRESN